MHVHHLRNDFNWAFKPKALTRLNVHLIRNSVQLFLAVLR